MKYTSTGIVFVEIKPISAKLKKLPIHLAKLELKAKKRPGDRPGTAAKVR